MSRMTYMCYQFEGEEMPLGFDEKGNPTQFEKVWIMCGLGSNPRMAIVDALHYLVEPDENCLIIYTNENPTPYDHIKNAQYLTPDEEEDTPGKYYVRPCEPDWYSIKKWDHWPYYQHGKPIIDGSGVLTVDCEPECTHEDFHVLLDKLLESKGLDYTMRLIEDARLRGIELAEENRTKQ